jgi:hypothetical protein
VLKGVVFDDKLPSAFWLDIQLLSKDRIDPVEFELMIYSQTDGHVSPHYSGHVTLCRELPAPQLVRNANLSRLIPTEVDRTNMSLYKDRRLFHGPIFQGIEQILDINQKRLMLACRLPAVAPQVQGQFPVQTINPYILDVQLQGMLVWTQCLMEQGCLPSHADSFEQFRAIPFDELFYISLEITTQTPTKLVADILAHDAEGMIYTRTLGLEVTISQRLNLLFETDELSADCAELHR